MKAILALLIFIALAVGAYLFLGTERTITVGPQTRSNIVERASEMGSALKQKLPEVSVRADEVREELKRTGKVVREKAREAGTALVDATADARTTAAIKARLVADPDLSARKISVDTTSGVVTLAGSVSSEEHIAKAINTALAIEGVREVISTLQVLPKK